MPRARRSGGLRSAAAARARRTMPLADPTRTNPGITRSAVSAAAPAVVPVLVLDRRAPGRHRLPDRHRGDRADDDDEGAGDGRLGPGQREQCHDGILHEVISFTIEILDDRRKLRKSIVPAPDTAAESASRYCLCVFECRTGP